MIDGEFAASPDRRSSPSELGCLYSFLPRLTPIDRDVLTSHKARIHKIVHRSQNIHWPARSIGWMRFAVVVGKRTLKTSTTLVARFALVIHFDTSRSDEIDADAPLLASDSHRMHQAQLSGLATCVTFLIRITLQRSERSHVDNG